MRFIGIDPSTKTGFVALDENGRVLKAKELTGVGLQDPKRMVTLIDEIMDHVKDDDFVAVEGFAYGAQGQGVSFQYGLGHGIRMSLLRKRISYTDITPSQLKKFASGKGNTKKDELAVHIFKTFGFENPSDNVRDAYVLAEIGRCLKLGVASIARYKYQSEVIDTILNPKPKVKKKKKVSSK